MILKIQAVMLLVAASVHYGQMEITYVQKTWPKFLGTCVTNDCELADGKPFDGECITRYLIHGKKMKEYTNLRLMPYGAYKVVDDDGEPTGIIYEIEDYPDTITKYTFYDENEAVVKIVCVTGTREIDALRKSKLDKYLFKFVDKFLKASRLTTFKANSRLETYTAVRRTSTVSH